MESKVTKLETLTVGEKSFIICIWRLKMVFSSAAQMRIKEVTFPSQRERNETRI